MMTQKEIDIIKNRSARKRVVHTIQQQPQSQASLDDQLRELQAIANKCGLYDAADFIETFFRVSKGT